ncbi:MAG: dihydroneopterin triphosphate 2'-epimerase [Gammaproteobacteria bacterium]|nr:dihydroneopterin triphosphate 2'-epimerase [Gammaproteobacteria bacterium]
MDRITSTIRITNLRLRTFIGFNPEEKAKKQDVVVNVEIDFRITQAALKDEVSGALDYKRISKKIISRVESEKFLLLEKLAKDILDICRANASVTAARVTVDKPHALRFADSVAIRLAYEQD